MMFRVEIFYTIRNISHVNVLHADGNTDVRDYDNADIDNDTTFTSVIFFCK